MHIIASFTIPGEPVAKGRARSFVRNGHVAHYTPDKTARYENLVKLAAQQAMEGRPPHAEGVRLIVRVYMGIPASWSQKKQREAALGTVVPTKRPDLDNTGLLCARGEVFDLLLSGRAGDEVLIDERRIDRAQHFRRRAERCAQARRGEELIGHRRARS